MASVLATVVLALALAFFQTPIASAQTNDATNSELRAAVETLLLADPRAASLPQQEFDEMVSALVAAAEKKGLTASEISWRPQPVSSYSQSASVGEIQACADNSILCMINEAFGFTGPDISIPMWFGICSAILLLILGGMIEVHRRTHAAPTIKK